MEIIKVKTHKMAHIYIYIYIYIDTHTHTHTMGCPKRRVQNWFQGQVRNIHSE
jgi:hypothetical protein